VRGLDRFGNWVAFFALGLDGTPFFEACHRRHRLEVMNMAWRPTKHLLEGELDNTTPGKVTGWMRFAGMDRKVTFDLTGNFHRDIRGAKIRFKGDGNHDDPEAAGYMDSFAEHQTGKVGDITAGLPPRDYTDYPYLEWFGGDNGRVVLELEQNQIEVIGTPIPACESDPISRKEQAQNMMEFMGQLAEGLSAQQAEDSAKSDDDGSAKAAPQQPAATKRSRRPGHRLLTEAIRRQLPPLYSQDGKAGEAVAYVKYFTPSAQWSWFGCEFDGKDTFFGLVDGQEKELGYFSLRELESVRGPMGLPVERDLYFKPTKLGEIAPELFATAAK
jgi:hypothetical protein